MVDGKKVAVVTGGATGIGKAFSRQCAEEGIDVVVLGRRLDRLVALREELQAAGHVCHTFVCDVTDQGSLDEAAAQVKKLYGKVDILLANAGFGVVGMFPELSVDDYERQFDTNVYGVIRTLKAFGPLVEVAKGHIGIVGSVNGFLAFAGNTPYAMSKFCIRGLSQGLYYEWLPKGVSVTHVAPGFVASELRLVDNHGVHNTRAKDPIPSWIVMPAEKAARKILKGILRRKREVVITTHGQVIVFLVKHFESLVVALIRRLGISARGEPA